MLLTQSGEVILNGATHLRLAAESAVIIIMGRRGDFVLDFECDLEGDMEIEGLTAMMLFGGFTGTS